MKMCKNFTFFEFRWTICYKQHVNHQNKRTKLKQVLLNTTSLKIIMFNINPKNLPARVNSPQKQNDNQNSKVNKTIMRVPIEDAIACL